MLDKNTINKACELYINSDKGIQEIATELHMNRRTYRKLLADNFDFVTIKNQDDAWHLYENVPDMIKFFRYINKSDKTGRKFLLNVVISDDDLKKLIEEDGMSTKKIVELVNMPFVTDSFIHDYAGRRGFRYSKEAIKKNRLEGLKKSYSKEGAVDKINAKRRKTMIDRYGVDSPMRVNSIKEKQQATTMERYGVPVSTMNKEVQKKQQATSLKNNGVPFPAQNQDIYAKVIKTNQEHYGADTYMLSEEGKKVSKKSMIERYGYDNNLSRPEVSQKIKEVIKKKYGVDNIGSVEQVREKIRKTNLAKFGGYTPFSDIKVREKSYRTNLEKYGYKSMVESPSVRKLAMNAKRDRVVFNKTYYVTDVDYSAELLLDQVKLEKFLRTINPSKYSYTLHEISDIIGREYNTVKSYVHTDGKFIVKQHVGELPRKMQSFLESLGFVANKDFIVNDRKAIKPLEIDFYFPKQKVGIEVNDLITHNHTYNPYGDEPKSKNYHMYKSNVAKDNGIRLIHAWEHYFNNPKQYEVLKNAIKHALGISTNRVYARNTYVREVPNSKLRDFFNTNNIQGFRGAKTAYALFDKKTNEILMAYSVGSSHFAHNKYDLELIRGASKLDTTIVGGASKLWKFIIDNNPDINSIVYYIDRNIYQGSSISSLEGNLELINTQPGFWNYFVKTGEMKNRQPSKHKEIKEMVANGEVWEVYNAGTETYVWHRE